MNHGRGKATKWPTWFSKYFSLLFLPVRSSYDHRSQDTTVTGPTWWAGLPKGHTDTLLNDDGDDERSVDQLFRRKRSEQILYAIFKEETTDVN